MAMETSQGEMEELIKMMEQSVNPHIGRNIDITL